MPAANSDHEVNIEDLAHFQQIVKENKLAVFDFYADWCGPCRMIAPKYAELAEQNSSVMKFCRVDVDNAQDVATACGIRAMPTFLFYKDGQQVHMTQGANIDAVRSKVRELCD